MTQNTYRSGPVGPSRVAVRASPGRKPSGLAFRGVDRLARRTMENQGSARSVFNR